MASRTVARLQLSELAQLIRLPLAAMVAVTAVAAAAAVPARVPLLTLWAVGGGVFLLAAASSVLNQVQERASDALMQRTCQRPLAAGLLSAAHGTAIGLTLGSGGVVVLMAGAGPGPALLGLAALAWYLFTYTPLKRRSPLAVLAGTPCGAVPPLLGWLAAGGNLSAPQPLALALLMVLWQVPHYWLLAMPDREQLWAAGFRVLPGLSDRQLLAVSRHWLLGLAVVTLLLPALDVPAAPLPQGVVIGLALALAATSLRVHRKALFPLEAARRLRRLLHLFLGLLLLTLLAAPLLTLPTS
jgi:protoheme IX farnesyltransferase